MQGSVISNILERDAEGIRSQAGKWGKVALCLVLISQGMYVDHGDLQNTLGKNTQDGKGMYGWIGDTNFPS